jgi:hypothetical protein
VKFKQCSLPLERAVSDFGFEDSFVKSVDRISEHYGFALPLSTVASVTRKHAEIIAQRQTLSAEDANALPAKGAGEIISQADGSFVRIVTTTDTEGDARKSREVNYKEVRLFASTAKGSAQTFYAATFNPVDTVAKLWAYTAKLAGMSLESFIHVVGDGATWIDRQSDIAFGEQRQLLIDLYHVLEYLAAAGLVCSDNPKRWLKKQKRRLKQGRADRVIQELKTYLEPFDFPDSEAPVRCAWRYLENRRENLAYDQAIANDLPLGSGMIESANKHIIQDRMKIPGASWRQETAENFVNARAMRANRQWNLYWQAQDIAA